VRQAAALFLVFIALGCASATRGQSAKSEAQTNCVAVIGAVNAPGRFELRRRIRLLEAITLAGGPKEQAGPTIQITSTGAECPLESSRDGRATAPPEKIKTFQAANVLRGEEESNPYLEGGDIVRVSDPECVYIIGHVVQPGQMFLKGRVALTQAITFAGGALKDAMVDRVRIIRDSSGSGARTELKFDLNKIRKKRAEDPVLQPNDIIDVPSRGSYGGDFGTIIGHTDPATPYRVIN